MADKICIWVSSVSLVITTPPYNRGIYLDFPCIYGIIIISNINSFPPFSSAPGVRRTGDWFSAYAIAFFSKNSMSADLAIYLRLPIITIFTSGLFKNA